MSLRQKISEITCIPESHVPGSYQIVGNILLVKFDSITRLGEKKKIAQAALKIMPSVKSAYEQKSIAGELRKPGIKFLAGEKTTKTVHNENSIRYSIDISKAMFSKGNLFERQRVIGCVKKGEIVVDMFAGIGYFSLGIAKFSSAREVITIEKSRDSFDFLKENIKLNRIKNMAAVLGDCREISKINEFRSIADRVIMGYLPGTKKFLPYALDFLKERGTIHYHDTFREEELWKVPEAVIEKAADEKGYRVISLKKRKVKSFAPRVWHVVVDAKLAKK